MDKIEKLFRKITKKERATLNDLLILLRKNEVAHLDIKKIKASAYYRVRIMKFRIIFHYQDGKFKLDDIRFRNENTYKNL